jgi:hypothetical protein
MKLRKKNLRPGWAILFLGLSFSICPKVALNQEKAAAESASSTPAQYVGVDVCKTCHSDLYEKNFANTPHFKTTLENGHGCESCHGPGPKHFAMKSQARILFLFSKKSQANETYFGYHKVAPLPGASP